MENGLSQFMVDFTLPPQLDESFIAKIPEQRSVINRLMHSGKVLSYALSLENSKLWAVFSVESETELLEIISNLPLTRFMKVRVSELSFFNAATTFGPAFSMN